MSDHDELVAVVRARHHPLVGRHLRSLPAAPLTDTASHTRHRHRRRGRRRPIGPCGPLDPSGGGGGHHHAPDPSRWLQCPRSGGAAAASLPLPLHTFLPSPLFYYILPRSHSVSLVELVGVAFHRLPPVAVERAHVTAGRSTGRSRPSARGREGACAVGCGGAGACTSTSRRSGRRCPQAVPRRARCEWGPGDRLQRVDLSAPRRRTELPSYLPLILIYFFY